MYRPITLAVVLAMVGLILSPLAPAEDSTQAGPYTIHHSAFRADTLEPEVARTYGFQRSKHRGLLTVSVIKEQKGTIGISTPATVEVSIVNLMGQKSPIPMREIKDQDAVYYMGEFPIYNEQTINFEIRVKPQGETTTRVVKMSQEFFTD